MTQSPVGVGIHDIGHAEQPSPRRRRVPRWVVWTLAVAAVIMTALAIALEYVIRHAEPMLRKRVVVSLEERFRSPVQLDALHITYKKGLISVSGSGLRILSLAGNTDPAEAATAGFGNAPPMLSVDQFSFGATARQLLEPVMRVQQVSVHGMRLDIPPAGQRGRLFSNDQKNSKGGTKMRIVVNRVLCTDLMLTIETDKPGKDPLVFPIRDLTLSDVGPGRPFAFDAWLVNPKPVGNIHSTGQFGPWDSDQPRDSPVQGDYSFTNANLDPIKGIAGTLSSTGRYNGSLGRIGVLGTTDVPNFSLDSSEHPVHLKTDFDATVDGTTGDTRLNHIHATFLNTALNVSGLVIRSRDARSLTGAPGDNPGNVPGHYIEISVQSDRAHIDDILRLAAKTSPPVMRGAMRLKAHLTIPPGHVTVSRKMSMKGTFEISGATLSNQSWQDTVDRLSARAEGNPEQAKAGETAPEVRSEMGGSFTMAHGLVHIPDLNYHIPGAEVLLAGEYSLYGDKFQFAGKVRTDATASAMLTGWKKWLAKPFDPLLKKDGAGVEVPVTIDGTRAEPKFGVDKGKLMDQIMSHFKRHHKDEQEQPPAK